MDMNEITAWLQLLFRWAHVIAAIMWIGQTWMFNWLESNLVREEGAGENTAGTLWMVHGGGFYIVEKQKFPELMPRTLHWFKWEAMATWITGIVLLILYYYLGGLLVNESASPLVELLVRQKWLSSDALFSSDTSYNYALAASCVLLTFGWFCYDWLVRSPLSKNPYVLGAIAYVCLAGVVWGLFQVMSGRAAYIHIGTLFGTIMVANVWMRILPSQSKMIALAREGQKPDVDLAARGPLRSRHNSFMSIPMVLIMISNHFPTLTYGHRYGWQVLLALVLVGWITAKFLVVASKKH